MPSYYWKTTDSYDQGVVTSADSQPILPPKTRVYQGQAPSHGTDSIYAQRENSQAIRNGERVCLSVMCKSWHLYVDAETKRSVRSIENLRFVLSHSQAFSASKPMVSRKETCLAGVDS